MQKFLSISDLAERYGISKPSIYNYVRDGKLPRGIHIGKAHPFEAELMNNQEINNGR